MERQFRLNWPALVEEAKQRRKSQRLTQKRLAALAGVSVPTVSRFESGERDIQLSSVTSILGVLGMLDERWLAFPAPKERYDFDRMVVTFEGTDGGRVVQCAISREALEDHFGGDRMKSITAFANARERIEHEARRKYLAGQFEADRSILLRTTDF